MFVEAASAASSVALSRRGRSDVEFFTGVSIDLGLVSFHCAAREWISRPASA